MMNKKPTYQDLEKELEKLKERNKTLRRENNELNANKENLVVPPEQLASESKNFDDELKSEQYLFNILMDVIPGRVYFKNRESQFVKISKSVAKWHNIVDPAVAIGKTDFDFFAKKHAEKAFRDEQEIIKSGIALTNIEEKESWKDGEITWSLSSKMPLINKKGQTLGILGVSRDITNQKLAEQALKENEEKLRMLFENSTNLFYSHTPNLVLTYMSQQVENVLGYTREEVMHRWTELASNHPVNEIGFRYTQKAIDTGIAQMPFELELLHKNGEKVWVEVREGPVVKNGKTKAIVGALIDITDRKKAEQALKESEEKYRLLIENQSDLIVKIDKLGRFLFVSKTYCNLFAKTEQELIGKTIMPFVHEDDRTSTKKTIKKLKNPPHKLYFRHRAITKNGIRWLSWMGTAVLDNNKNLIEIIAVGRDITDKVNTENNLIESERKLRELNATKDKFFSIIGHDLRSPFNTMLGFAKLLITNFDSFNVQKQKKFLGILTNDLENTYNLLENLLLWARTQRGTIDFYPEKENLYLLTGETVELLRQSAADKAIFLINQIPEDIYVNADKNMLLSILRNLISNAIKFTPKEGTVKIGVKTRHVIETGHTLSLTEIYVKDNGVGMANEKQVQLFEISENISTKGTEDETGTGLGLILCKEFVEKHGGQIRVESKVGKGSEFIFTVPLVR